VTYRERREARAERLRGWAGTRQERAASTLASHEKYRGDHAFNFQPGHIPERARVIAREDRAFESLRKAASMESRASGIESQLERSIYSDDPDAIPALEARLAVLEAQRDEIKTFNAAARRIKPVGDPAQVAALVETLSPAGRREYLGMRKSWGSVYFGKTDQFPPYHLSNLSGNIKRNRDRLEQLQRRAARESRPAPAPPPVELDWVASPEVSGLQGSMPIEGAGTQLGLFRRHHHRARARRSRRA
jgi:hypothetical protein